MRILAFDCAGAQCAGAIVADGKTIATRQIATERGHAQVLVPLLCDLLAEGHLRFSDIDRLAVTTGPGSFTGIRVALATAHGLRLATGAPIVGVTVFDALAAQALETKIDFTCLVVAVESKRTECFVQLFDAVGAVSGLPAMVSPDDLSAWAGLGPLAIIGDAALRIAPHLPAAHVYEAPRSVDPVTLARIAGNRVAGPPPAPLYLRPPDAIPASAR